MPWFECKDSLCVMSFVRQIEKNRDVRRAELRSVIQVCSGYMCHNLGIHNSWLLCLHIDCMTDRGGLCLEPLLISLPVAAGQQSSKRCVT
jgi:hypothetical protein